MNNTINNNTNDAFNDIANDITNDSDTTLNSMGIPINDANKQKSSNSNKNNNSKKNHGNKNYGNKKINNLPAFIGIIIGIIAFTAIVIGIIHFVKTQNTPLSIAKTVVESFNNKDKDAFIELLPEELANTDDVSDSLEVLFYYDITLDENGDYDTNSKYEDEKITEIEENYNISDISDICYVTYDSSYSASYNNEELTGDISFTITTVKIKGTWYYLDMAVND